VVLIFQFILVRKQERGDVSETDCQLLSERGPLLVIEVIIEIGPHLLGQLESVT